MCVELQRAVAQWAEPERINFRPACNADEWSLELVSGFGPA